MFFERCTIALDSERPRSVAQQAGARAADDDLGDVLALRELQDFVGQILADQPLGLAAEPLGEAQRIFDALGPDGIGLLVAGALHASPRPSSR